MVTRVLFCLSILWLPVAGHAASLQVALDDNQVEMGKFILARVVYEGETVPGLADLQQWQDDFVIDRRDREVENLVSGKIRTIETLRLYPRSTGEKTLGVIALGGTFNNPVNVTVKPALRDGIDGTPRWLTWPERVWQGQTIELAVELALFNTSNHITVEADPFPGFAVVDVSRATENRDGISWMRLEWQLLALHKGIKSLELPAIEQRGHGRWRFYLPRIEIEVRPLPGYLPSTVPVGQLTIQTDADKSARKPIWQVLVQSKGQLPEEVYGVRTQLSAAAGQSVETVEVRVDEQGSRAGKVFEQRYRVPVPDWSWGLFSTPEISVRYFDSEEGRLKLISERLPGVWQVPESVRYLIWTVSGLVLLFVLGVATLLVKRFISWRRYRQLLAQAEDAHQLRRVLLEPRAFRTLDAWAKQGRNVRAAQLADQLNQLCFSLSCNINLAEVRCSAIAYHSYLRWIGAIERLAPLMK